ncbi:hypothetical protein F443_03690 [Phytophthora nicotianae P1569]|uniref:Uncharacterized protein n=1 Tax=Phytophthora nicotianae P1569 TaxID=1317065 RepID=V9FPE0_PHYNI|nr:hypothetical protein F443_03690 [Phytophthora nicotianae P1569]
MEESDEAMVPHPRTGMPIAVYPPLPPYTDRELTLIRETTTRTVVMQGGETHRQVEALAQHSAAVQQMTAEQLGQVKAQQEHLAAKTPEYLQQQHDRNSAIHEQQQDMKQQMEEQRRFLEIQFRLLKAAEEAVGLQEQRLESLAEAVQPHLQARWGAFEQGAAPPSVNRSSERPAVTVAAAANLPVPPIYRGSSKKEKRDFIFLHYRGSINHGRRDSNGTKESCRILVEALHPPAFKAAVKDQLGRQIHKAAKSSIQAFLKWLRVELEGFMRFEAHIAVHAAPKSSTNFPPSSASTGPEKKGPRRTGGGKATSSEAKLATSTGGEGNIREEHWKKVMKPVLVATSGETTQESSASIPCLVMGAVETLITPDSAASVSLVTMKLINDLKSAEGQMEIQPLAKPSDVTVVGDKLVPFPYGAGLGVTHQSTVSS